MSIARLSHHLDEVFKSWRQHGVIDDAGQSLLKLVTTQPKNHPPPSSSSSSSDPAKAPFDAFDERDFPLTKWLSEFEKGSGNHEKNPSPSAIQVIWDGSARAFLHAIPTLQRMATKKMPVVIHIASAKSPPLQALYDMNIIVLSSPPPTLDPPQPSLLLQAAFLLSCYFQIPVIHIYSTVEVTAMLKLSYHNEDGFAQQSHRQLHPYVLDSELIRKGSTPTALGTDALIASPSIILDLIGLPSFFAPKARRDDSSRTNPCKIVLLVDAAHADSIDDASLPADLEILFLFQILPTPIEAIQSRFSETPIIVSYQPFGSQPFSPFLVDILSRPRASHRCFILVGSRYGVRIDGRILNSLRELLLTEEDGFVSDQMISIDVDSLTSSSTEGAHRPPHLSTYSLEESGKSGPSPSPDDRLQILDRADKTPYEALLLQLFESKNLQIHKSISKPGLGTLSEAFGRSLASLTLGVSNWLIAGVELEYDEGINAIQNIFKGSQSVKLLVIDTTPLSSLRGHRSRTGRRDVGLYAIHYGTTYVASISLFASYPQTVQALSEAEAHPGSAILVAYLPELHPDDDTTLRGDPLCVLRHSKEAVDEGLWPLYRYNPTERDENRFQLDSKHLKQQLSEYLDKENKLSKIIQSNSTTSPLSSISETSVEAQVREMHLKLLETSFRKLISGLQSSTPQRGSVLLLFASDGGNAVKAAKATSDSLTKAGFGPLTLKAMDDTTVLEAFEHQETPVLFFISTAGQGEFPTNGKHFWASVKGMISKGDSNKLLLNTRFGIFGLGDSHYWPRAEDAHYFCKPAKELSEALSGLGSEQLLRVGLGDDQAPDQWKTDYQAWQTELLVALGCGDLKLDSTLPQALPPPDIIKRDSNFLRGTIALGLMDESTGSLAAKDTLLTKFHGIYQQDDRDLRESRRKLGMEPAYSFMVRIRAPGGVITPRQWLNIDDIANRFGGGQFRLTTRQALQFHGIIKRNLKQTIQEINRQLMDTLAACGDVNRNVMCSASSPAHISPQIYAEIQKVCNDLSEYLTPRTTAYHEIWLDKTPVAGQVLHDIEPIYGPTYLPRKFKISIAIPPSNDVDVYAGDLGFIAIVGGGGSRLEGFNVVVGGGMGMTHNVPTTYPKVGQLMGFVTPNQVLPIAEAVILVQRDHGNRENRRRARLKYTIEDKGGMSWLVAEVQKISRIELQPLRPFHFTSTGDLFGWQRNALGLSSYCIFVENGRIKDAFEGTSSSTMKSGLKELSLFAESRDILLRLTPNQSLIIDNVSDEDRATVDGILSHHSLSIAKSKKTAARLNSMACVALPTCGLALSESERFLPHLMDVLDQVLHQLGLEEEPINIRMSGCPNGCSRPYLAEIALVGRAPNIYNMYLGASHNGDRLASLYADGLSGDQIIQSLTPILTHYAQARLENERFGDFVLRMKYVRHSNTPADFHPQLVEI